jgi:hypothetical protein
MDSSVLATLISTPVALLAAAAAYAAGRVQGRGAYQGPIAAVRRQHQRDAYAAFLTAANAHIRQTSWQTCLDAARIAIGITTFMDESREEVEQRATQIRARVPLESLQAATSVVSLEAPSILPTSHGPSPTPPDRYAVTRGPGTAPEASCTPWPKAAARIPCPRPTTA